MITGERGVVLRFRKVWNAPSPAHGRLRASAAPAVTLPEAGDDQINSDWDLLIRVASHAWSWRDPDSLSTLEQTVERLRDWIDRDWTR